MKTAISIVAICCLFALAAAAAAIDGKWVFESQGGGKKAGGQTMQTILDLKSNGDQLTGSVSTGRRGRSMEIKDGKIEGNKFSFTTVQRNRKGDAKIKWTGSLEGSELRGTRAREGGRGQSFVAKRQ